MGAPDSFSSLSVFVGTPREAPSTCRSAHDFFRPPLLARSSPLASWRTLGFEEATVARRPRPGVRPLCHRSVTEAPRGSGRASEDRQSVAPHAGSDHGSLRPFGAVHPVADPRHQSALMFGGRARYTGPSRERCLVDQIARKVVAGRQVRVANENEVPKSGGSRNAAPFGVAMGRPTAPDPVRPVT